MSVFDHFFNNTQVYEGRLPEKLDRDNLDELIAKHGTAWVDGYMAAMEAFAVDLADILSPREDNPCGFNQTAQRVRTNLVKYWEHNKYLYKVSSSQLNPLNPKDGPEMK